MMSPEPPKEEAAGADDNSTESSDETFAIITRAQLLDFMERSYENHHTDYPDSVSDNESPGEDDDDEGGAFHSHFTDNGTESRVRGHYQLLIPFPPTENHSESEVEFRHSSGRSVETSTNTFRSENSTTTTPVAESSEFSVDFERANPRPETEPASRGIQLTAEKSEAIRTVMKGISLPSTAIPEWAKEVSDDVWQRRLKETLDKKQRQE